MTDVPWDYDAFLHRVVAWADERPDLRGVVVLGSRARAEHRADDWSDVDLLLVTTDPDRYLAASDWLSALGEVWLTFREPAATGDLTERRALFAPGLDADFVPISADEVEAVVEDGADALASGYRVVYDEMSLEDALADAVPDDSPSFDPPGADEFRETCVDFWYHAVWAAKKLRRGEVWTAKGCVDGYAKRECLLPMLSWHAVARHDRDPWYEGRFLESWADDRALADLGDAFAEYDAEDPADCWRALVATMDLFRWVAEETAAALDYEYPRDGDERATRLVERLRAGRERP